MSSAVTWKPEDIAELNAPNPPRLNAVDKSCLEANAPPVAPVNPDAADDAIFAISADKPAPCNKSLTPLPINGLIPALNAAINGF